MRLVGSFETEDLGTVEVYDDGTFKAQGFYIRYPLDLWFRLSDLWTSIQQAEVYHVED